MFWEMFSYYRYITACIMGLSLNLMLRDFSMLCRDLEIPDSIPFSKTAQATSKGSVEAETFWVNSLDGFRGGSMVPALQQLRKAKVTLNINLAAVLDGCKRLVVTVQSVALLAFGKTLAWLFGRLDIVLGHVVSGRTLSAVDAEENVGPLFNTIPRRFDLSQKTTTNEEAVRALQTTTGDSQAYQHASLSRVQQVWREKADLPDARLLDALFVFHKKASGTEEVLWRPVTVENDDKASTEYPINFEINQSETDIEVRVNGTGIVDLDVFLREFESILLDIVQSSGYAKPEVYYRSCRSMVMLCHMVD